MFEIGAKLGSFAQQSACAAGGYFFRFAGKVTKKGRLLCKEANTFLYGNCGRAMQSVPIPATYCGGSGERHRTAAHRGEACRGVGDSGKAITCRELPSGANRTWRSTPAPRLRCVVQQVGAYPVAARCAD
ncbi:MAG: hypothetical protein LBO63_01905 [Oscillospiraceae bacterium]|nr:hypothetical protein [Oscillospiraceae bacterium]